MKTSAPAKNKKSVLLEDSDSELENKIDGSPRGDKIGSLNNWDRKISKCNWSLHLIGQTINIGLYR